VAKPSWKPWVIEVQYQPQGDQRRRLWSRSVPMTYSEAKLEALRYEAVGHKVRLVELGGDAK